MSLQTIPDDIILGIIQHASWKKNQRVYFKQRLYLLAVSQRLRAIALPEIYNHVYITFSKSINSKSQKYVNKYSKEFAKYIDTNADIIALANYTHMIKFAIIWIDGITTTYTELHNSIKALQLCANSWPKVSNLAVYMEYNNSSSNPSGTHLLQLHYMGEKYSRELANSFPNVTELLLFTRFFNCDTSGLYYQVIGAYADQLVKLCNIYGFDYTDMYKLKAMQYVNLRMGYSIKRLPRVNSHTLVDLYIGNCPFNVSWVPFMDSKDDTVIEFSCLKKLSLNFSFYKATKHKNTDTPELLLNFPELKLLRIISKKIYLSVLQDGKISKSNGRC